MGLYKHCVALAMIAGSLSLPVPAHAEKGINARLSAKKTEQAALAQKAQSLDSEVSGLQKKLVALSRDLRHVEQSLSASDARLKALEAEKARHVARLYQEETVLGGLVTAARKLRRTSTPHMLMQTTPVHAARAALVMQSIMPALNAQAKSLRERIAQIDGIEKTITESLAEKKKDLNKISKQKENLDKLLKERQSAYKQTVTARKAQEREVEKLARESRDIEELVSKIQKKPAYTTRTTRTAARTYSAAPPPPPALAPVHGAVYTAFGDTDDLGAKSKGITYKAAAGAMVVTPLAGKVKFAGPFQKFRQILIIEHADGYHSLIAGLGRIDTVTGASLAAGEPVGAAETSVAEARIYYELLRNGKPVNPKKMTLAQRKQEKS